MRVRVTLCVTVALILFALAPVVLADAPTLVNYQGILLDSFGNPITVPSNVRFIIYDAAFGGNIKWSDTYSITPDAAGRFNVLLGSGAFPIIDTVFNARERWLGITVEMDPEMTPRSQIVTVGYAFRVSTVDGASGGNITSKISIGSGHTNTGSMAFVAGGANIASGDYSTVSGGFKHVATGEGATISGGASNEASGEYSAIGGGNVNKARGNYSVVAGGGGSAAGDSNSATGLYSAIGGGTKNRATGESSVVGGGESNYASGTQSTVGGGQLDSVFSSYATVAGGRRNRAKYAYAAIGGGYNNVVESHHYGTIGGGSSNLVSGEYATVPGGRGNEASGEYSFAAGRYAKAIAPGSFIWSDASVALDFVAANLHEFAARATGGVRFVTAVDGYGNPTSGVQVAAGGGSWSAISDRNAKENFVPVDGDEILEKLSSLPLSTWNYKSQDKSIRHIGPIAQDLYAAFGLGEDDKHIATIDADGIALAAIQALHKENRELKHELAQLRAMMQQILSKQE